MRKEFELSDVDLAKLKRASRSKPLIIVGGMMPESPQITANREWQRIGEKMGFDFMSVIPSMRGERYFSAEVSTQPVQSCGLCDGSGWIKSVLSMTPCVNPVHAKKTP